VKSGYNLIPQVNVVLIFYLPGSSAYVAVPLRDSHQRVGTATQHIEPASVPGRTVGPEH